MMIVIVLKIAVLLLASFIAGALMGAFLRRNFNFEVKTLPPAVAVVPAKTAVQVEAEPKTKPAEAPAAEVAAPIATRSEVQEIVVEVVKPAAKPAKKPAKSKKSPAKTAQDAEVLSDSAEMKRPVGLFAPRDDKADDLKLIRGIGPTNERKLNQIGIYHYDQIANWSVGEAEWINSFLEFPGRVDREDWIAQAKALVR